jgi:hypothetical protein
MTKPLLVSSSVSSDESLGSEPERLLVTLGWIDRALAAHAAPASAR